MNWIEDSSPFFSSGIKAMQREMLGNLWHIFWSVFHLISYEPSPLVRDTEMRNMNQREQSTHLYIF